MTNSKKNKTPENFQPPPLEALNFTYALTHVAVSQICQSVGYTSAKFSALRTLTTVAGFYLKTLTNLAGTNANRFGRTESNLFDVVMALEDLGSVKGFKGIFEVNKSLFKNSILLDLIEFVDRVDEIPFAQSIRRLKDGSFGIGGESVSDVKGNVGGDGVSVRNVPDWLPRFPDVNSYLEDDGGSRGRFRSGEVLFPNGGVEEVIGNVEDLKSGCGGRELTRDRCRVKFRIDVKRRKSGVEVGFINGGVGVSRDENEKQKERAWKEAKGGKENVKKVYVRRGLLSKNREKMIVQWREEVLKAG